MHALSAARSQLLLGPYHIGVPQHCTMLTDDDCVICKDKHFLRKCHEFLHTSVEDRHTFVTDSGLCFNCLGSGHHHHILQALVLPKPTGFLPREPIRLRNQWPHLEGLKMGDTTFDFPGRIDLLLGADIYPYLLCSGLHTGSAGSPVAIETVWLGAVWTIGHKTDPLQLSSMHRQMFCELEEIKPVNILAEEETLCEHHFNTTHGRN
ncbi:hypothetical protein PR048_016310 [Dryococelus australis]|uniref:Uncharacterized protein n=1 Tax=Dryococelus australis TaxID=614101 RepID=A0ABQ9HKI2_9NEOP|nr:hypothetical protein PR048_016310 [Dryococelus australis]